MPLTLRSIAPDVRPSPFAAPAAPAAGADGRRAPQGTFAAHLTLTLYGADGRVRHVQDGPPSLIGAKLGEDVSAVIAVSDAQGREVTVTVRKDGTYAAVEHAGGGIVRYDSRDGAAADTAARDIADRGARIAALAAPAGSDAALATAASSALAGAAGPSGSFTDVTVTITDAKGVSRYAGGADGVISASRTTADVALETTAVDHGVQIDAIRRVDGSGTTTVGGGALGGTTLTLTHDRNGAEHVDIASGDGSNVNRTSDIAVVDAFGTRITIGGSARGHAHVALTDAAGTTFDFDASAAGGSAALAVTVGAGSGTGTQRAELTEDVTAESSTGSEARAASAFEMTARDTMRPGARSGGAVTIAIDASVASTSRTTPDGTRETLGTAHVGVHARAAGAVDVAGDAAGSAVDGYKGDEGKPGVAGATQRDGKGGVALDDAASREIVALEVDVQGDDRRKADRPDDSVTHDRGSIRLDAFGRHAAALRSDDVVRKGGVNRPRA